MGYKEDELFDKMLSAASNQIKIDYADKIIVSNANDYVKFQAFLIKAAAMINNVNVENLYSDEIIKSYEIIKEGIEFARSTDPSLIDEYSIINIENEIYELIERLNDLDNIDIDNVETQIKNYKSYILYFKDIILIQEYLSLVAIEYFNEEEVAYQKHKLAFYLMCISYNHPYVRGYNCIEHIGLSETDRKKYYSMYNKIKDEGIFSRRFDNRYMYFNESSLGFNTKTTSEDSNQLNSQMKST